MHDLDRPLARVYTGFWFGDVPVVQHQGVLLPFPPLPSLPQSGPSITARGLGDVSSLSRVQALQGKPRPQTHLGCILSSNRVQWLLVSFIFG